MWDLAAWRHVRSQTGGFESLTLKLKSTSTPKQAARRFTAVAIINYERDTRGAGLDFDKQVCDPQKQLEAVVVTFRW